MSAPSSELAPASTEREYGQAYHVNCMKSKHAIQRSTSQRDNFSGICYTGIPVMHKRLQVILEKLIKPKTI